MSPKPPKTQDTKLSSFNPFKKEKASPSSTEPDQGGFELAEPTAEEQRELELQKQKEEALVKAQELGVAKEERMKAAMDIMELDTKVEIAKRANIKWMEVDAPVLAALTNKETWEKKDGYIIYKNMKLCLPGMAKDLAKKEDMDIHEILFAEEAKKFSVSSVAKDKK